MIPGQHGYCPRCDDRVEFVAAAGGDAVVCVRCDRVQPLP